MDMSLNFTNIPLRTSLKCVIWVSYASLFWPKVRYKKGFTNLVFQGIGLVCGINIQMIFSLTDKVATCDTVHAKIPRNTILICLLRWYYILILFGLYCRVHYYIKTVGLPSFVTCHGVWQGSSIIELCEGKTIGALGWSAGVVYRWWWQVRAGADGESARRQLTAGF